MKISPLRVHRITSTFVAGILYLCLGAAAAHAGEDVDWSAGLDPLYEDGPESQVIGKRWIIGSRRDDVIFQFMFDGLTDMSKGGWHGTITAPEKFYVKTFTTNDAGLRRVLKMEGARAVGEDSISGSWKEGPETQPFQTMVFTLSREALLEAGEGQDLIIEFAKDETPDIARDIVFPLATFSDRLQEIDASIKENGGSFYLMTQAEIDATPVGELPQFMIDKSREELLNASFALDINAEDLLLLSADEISARLDAKAKADRKKVLAAREAEHQAIYAMEPDWLDLNLCPKPDVSYCDKVGLEAFANDIWTDGDFIYGKILGVIWRSEGSIVHIYPGMVEYDRDPEIVRAKEAAYYYIIKTPKGFLDIRAAKGMKTR